MTRAMSMLKASLLSSPPTVSGGPRRLRSSPSVLGSTGVGITKRSSKMR